MPKKYHIILTEQERKQLRQIVDRGKASALKRRHAQILLKVDENRPQGACLDQAMADALEVDVRTVERVRRIAVEHGLERALQRKDPDRQYGRKLDGKAEARLIALACRHPPDGRQRGTLRLLAAKLVALQIVESIGSETVRRTLKKNELKPWRKKQWCLAPRNHAAFVCAMEDVLEVYHRPADPSFPLVCLDETTKQLVAETRRCIAAKPGRMECVDYEYRGNGVATLFMLLAPVQG